MLFRSGKSPNEMEGNYSSGRTADKTIVVLSWIDTAYRDEDLDADGKRLNREVFREKFQSFCDDPEVMLVAVNKDGELLEVASTQLKDNPAIVRAAVQQKGGALKHASFQLRNNPHFVLRCIEMGCDEDAFLNASSEVRNNPEVALAAIQHTSKESMQLRQFDYVGPELQNDPVFIRKAVSICGRMLQYTQPKFRSNQEIVFAAMSNWPPALRHASKELWHKKEFVMRMVKQNGWNLASASNELRSDKEVVLAAVGNHGGVLSRYASDELQSDKEVVLAAVNKTGDALQELSNELRSDKEVVLAAVKSDPLSLQFALGGLNQDPDCLIAAGIWDQGYTNRIHRQHQKLIVLSTRFSLAKEKSNTATEFTLLLKEHPYIQEQGFDVYSPNAFEKSTCDPDWTNINWPCRGTKVDCQKIKVDTVGVPAKDCCWRYSFRHELEEAKRRNGFMIQVAERDWEWSDYKQNLGLGQNVGQGQHNLGQGQQIELEMARSVGIQVFQVLQPTLSSGSVFDADEPKFDYSGPFNPHCIDYLITNYVKKWYDEDEAYPSNSRPSQCHRVEFPKRMCPVIDF